MMRVLMLRNTVVARPGQAAAPVDAGTIVELDAAVAMQLLALCKAALIDGDAQAPGVFLTPEQTVAPVEKRKRKVTP